MINNDSIINSFIHFVKKGLLMLDGAGRAEVAAFIKSQQQATGAFKGRGGRPDYYYSLFGALLAVANGQNHELLGFKQFLEESKGKKLPVADVYASVIISPLIFSGGGRPSKIKLIKLLFRKESGINLPYRIFLFLVAYDNFYRLSSLIKVLFRIILLFFKPAGGSPCSLYAALLVAREKLSMDTALTYRKILSYFDEVNGFKVYRQNNTADLLSTAVALYALRVSGYDLRLIAPACLKFVQDNYCDGAFLSGDGDQTRDLEYTFYGLLALGTLS